MASTNQRFDGRKATTDDDVVVKHNGTLYPGVVTSINTGNDTPNITVTEDGVGELQGLTFVDVPASLREAQANGSWFWVSAVPPPSVVKEKRAKLDADASAITSTSWTYVLSCALATDGDSFVEIEASCQAGVVLGGSMRALIDGGSFSNVELATSTYPVLSGSAPGFIKAYVDLPASAQIYTMKIQASAVTLGSVTPRAGSSLFVTEKRWPA